MEIMSMYYYASLPIVTCNLLLYSIQSLSTSITSTQNVFRFIYEHKNSDYLIYKNEIRNFDLLNKIKIIESLITYTIQKYIPDKDDYEKFMSTINNPKINNNENDNFNIIDIEYNSNILSKIDTPVAYSIISLIEIINNINKILNTIKDKIVEHRKVYFKNFYTLCLKKEISDLTYQNYLLDLRYKILIDLLKIFYNK